MDKQTTINIAPTAETVKHIYEVGGGVDDETYAIAVLACRRGYGNVAIDRVSVTLKVKSGCPCASCN